MLSQYVDAVMHSFVNNWNTPFWIVFRQKKNLHMFTKARILENIEEIV